MFVTNLPQVYLLKNLKKIIVSAIVICIYILSLFLAPKQVVFAQSASCAPDEIDTLSYMLPSTPKLTTVRFNTGVEESYSTVKKGTSGGKSCFYIIKGTNFEQYCYDRKYIYFMQDTSWATGPNQDVMCQGSNSQATLSLVDPATNSPGAKAFNRCQKIGQNFTFDQKIVPINEDTCQKCSVSGVAPGGSSVTGRFERSGDFLNMFSVAGPGQGERRIFKKNCGLWGFQFSDGTRAEPLPGKECVSGSLPAPENVCSLGTNDPLVLRDPASLLAQEGFNASFESIVNNYTGACAPMTTFNGKLTGDSQNIVINNVETKLIDYCRAHPAETVCVFTPSGQLSAMASEQAKFPYYSSDGVGDRSSSYMSFISNDSSDGDLLETAPYFKFTPPDMQCVQNINIMRAVNQICQTLPAIGYQELVSGGGSVLAASSEDGACSIDLKLVTPKGSKRIMDVYKEIKKLQDQDPNDGFKSSEDFCTLAYQQPTSDSAINIEMYEKSQNILEYVKKVTMFRNVYEVGYIVYVRDYIPTKITIFELLFPFFSFNNSNRDEIPIQIVPVLFPYGLASQKSIESDSGERPRDYVTGHYTQTFSNLKSPEEIRNDGNKEVAEIDKLQSSFPQGYPEIEDEETCKTFICCPKCKEVLARSQGKNEGFKEDTFKAIVGAFINKNIDAGIMPNFGTRFGEQNNESLEGSFTDCRVTQKEINGETSTKIGSSIVQQSIYPTIIDSLFSILGIVKVGGANTGSSASTSIRTFVITPDESRALRNNEGDDFTRFLNPDYIDIVNKQIKNADKNPVVQFSGMEYGVNTTDDEESFDAPTPANPPPPPPQGTETPKPQKTVTAGIESKDLPSNGEGPMVPGAMFARGIVEMVGKILSPPDGPAYTEKYTTLEDYWTGEEKGSSL